MDPESVIRVRPTPSASYIPPPKPVLQGTLTLARILSFFGGLIVLYAMTLPMFRLDAGSPDPTEGGSQDLADWDRIRGTPANSTTSAEPHRKEVSYWDMPSSPDDVDVPKLASVCVAAGMLACILAVTGHVAGLWIPGLTLVTIAFPFVIIGWTFEGGQSGESPWMIAMGGCLMLLATLGGSRRANALVLAPLAVLTSWLNVTGIAVSLIGILVGAFAIADAESRRRSAIARGSRGQDAGESERILLLAACSVSALGLLMGAAKLYARMV